jgi:hypothetical protein
MITNAISWTIIALNVASWGVLLTWCANSLRSRTIRPWLGVFANESFPPYQTLSMNEHQDLSLLRDWSCSRASLLMSSRGRISGLFNSTLLTRKFTINLSPSLFRCHGSCAKPEAYRA